MLTIIATVAGILFGLIGAATAISTLCKNILEIRKLQSEGGKAKPDSFDSKNVKVSSTLILELHSRLRGNVQNLSIITIVVVLLLVAFLVLSTNTSQQIATLQGAQIKAVSDINDLKAEVASLTATNKGQKELIDIYLPSNLMTFVGHYRSHVETTEKAIEEYKSFNSAANREKYPSAADFARQKQELLAIVKAKLQAIVDHVENWKPVMPPFQALLNGRVSDLDLSLKSNKEEDIFLRFSILRENLTSDMDRLKAALEQAVRKTDLQSEGTGPQSNP